ncbi:hypothetical protein ACHAXR_009757, partial [Thalassiosira sp. AJA248-18]
MGERIISLLVILIYISECHVRAFGPSPLLSSRRSAGLPSSSCLHSTKEPSSISSGDTIVQDGPDEIIANTKNEKAPISTTSQSKKEPNNNLINGTHKRKMELAWCNHDSCYEAIREKVVGEHNHMELTGPATGQVAYSWEKYSVETGSSTTTPVKVSSPPAVLILVKHDDEKLLAVAVDAIEQLMNMGVQILMDSTLMGDLESYDNIDLDSDMVRLFDPKPVPGFGSGEHLFESVDNANGVTNGSSEDGARPADLSEADLVVTLGGDGLLMYAAHVFSGPVPPILPVAGGSMGFLTPFAREEMLQAILISLGLREVGDDEMEIDDSSSTNGLKLSQRANNNMQIEAITQEGYDENPPLAFGSNNQICISMRMRLDCRIFGSDGSLRARYAVLNEIVIDRGSSPYLASLECFCDDVHLTTVQADGIIFSTPTGSTAYSMAAGGSVVHPAVPAILVTPICPHVLSFRSMVFPDHVVLSCIVPSDARSTACVYFDGKHRTELNRGDSVQIKMSAHPVPTINRADHSSDWLSSLK